MYRIRKLLRRTFVFERYYRSMASNIEKNFTRKSLLQHQTKFKHHRYLAKMREVEESENRRLVRQIIQIAETDPDGIEGALKRVQGWMPDCDLNRLLGHAVQGRR